MTESVVAKDPGPGVRGAIPQGLAAPGLEGETTQTGSETSVGKGYLPREIRVKLFDEVVSLRKMGLTYRRIIDEVWGRYGIRLYKSHVSVWTRGIHSPYNGRYIPSIELLRPSEELAYIIGVKLGDGYAIKRRRIVKGYNNVRIGLEVRDREFAVEFARCLATVLRREQIKPIYRKPREKYVSEVKSKTLYELLKKPVELDRLKEYIEHCDKCISAFLRGFADAEGCVDKSGYISICNTDHGLLTYVKGLLQRLGVTSSEPKAKNRKGSISRFRNGYYRRNRDCYYIYIRAASCLTFHRKVGFTIKRKQKRLENYIKRRQAKPPSPFFHLPK